MHSSRSELFTIQGITDMPFFAASWCIGFLIFVLGTWLAYFYEELVRVSLWDLSAVVERRLLHKKTIGKWNAVGVLMSTRATAAACKLCFCSSA